MFTLKDKRMRWTASQRPMPTISADSMCIALSMMAMVICFGFEANSETIDFTKLPEYKLSYDAFMAAYKSPVDSVRNKVNIPENPLFVRTTAVQKLYDYQRAVTKLQHAELYAADPHYRHVECAALWTNYTDTVIEFVKSGGLYNQELLASITERVAIDESIQKGLPVWPGHNGLVATEDIASGICIGIQLLSSSLNDEQYQWL